MKQFKNFRIFTISLAGAGILVLLKYVLHELDWEVITQSSLHNSVISGAFFVIGFLLSATIADYKESERIPSEFSSIIENMYEDAASSHATYNKFNLDAFRKQLIKIAENFKTDVRNKTHHARHEVHQLNKSFIEMEKAGVPPNYIVKLKQQQAQLARSLFRVNYIQNIKFIPSATILARSIVVFSVALLLVTNIDPFFGGMGVTALISFIMLYVIILIQVISTPFHAAGKTQDDISLFLVSEARGHLKKQQ